MLRAGELLLCLLYVPLLVLENDIHDGLNHIASADEKGHQRKELMASFVRGRPDIERIYETSYE
jgi:hypothetical protein